MSALFNQKLVWKFNMISKSFLYNQLRYFPTVSLRKAEKLKIVVKPESDLESGAQKQKKPKQSSTNKPKRSISSTPNSIMFPDPNKPIKPPLNVSLFFTEEYINQNKDKIDTNDIKVQQKILDIWKKLGKKEKDLWKSKQENALKEYEIKINEYNNNNFAEKWENHVTKIKKEKPLRGWKNWNYFMSYSLDNFECLEGKNYDAATKFRILGEKWRNMSENERKTWNDRFNQEMDEWKKNLYESYDNLN